MGECTSWTDGPACGVPPYTWCGEIPYGEAIDGEGIPFPSRVFGGGGRGWACWKGLGWEAFGQAGCCPGTLGGLPLEEGRPSLGWFGWVPYDGFLGTGWRVPEDGLPESWVDRRRIPKGRPWGLSGGQHERELSFPFLRCSSIPLDQSKRAAVLATNRREVFNFSRRP